MGNQMCCEGATPHKDNIVIQLADKKKDTNISNDGLSPYPLSQNIAANLQKYKPFQDQLKNQVPLKQFGDQIYEGHLDEKQRPSGIGKMYYKNGSLYVGQFHEGKAQGQAHYFWPDGSYYRGQMKNNKANDKNGFYSCGHFAYQGSIKDNEFNGQAKQIGENYEFNGEFEKGKRKKGKLVWKEAQFESEGIGQAALKIQKIKQFIYEGQFDDNGLFTGQGSLKTQNGVYKGKFKQGKKHGYGVFEYQNKSRYEGTYENDVKEGNGTIYTKSNKIAYCGQMMNGLPHGDGWVPLPDGKPNHLKWNQGISSIIVSDQEALEAMRSSKV